MTIDEAISHALEVAQQEECFINYPHSDIVLGDLDIESRKHYVAEQKQLAEWLMELKDLRAEQNEQYVFIHELMSELKEAKRLLKLAVKQMAEVGDICDCIHSQNCPLDECGKFTFHDEIVEFINN